MRKPTPNALLWALLNSSLAFFLFSYQAPPCHSSLEKGYLAHKETPTSLGLL
jgi:hypothetical protein